MDEDLPIAEAAVLAVLYAPGRRPSIDAVRHAAERSGGFSVTHAPDPAEGWAELLMTGLSYDVVGLAPGPGESTPPVAHRFGLPDEWEGDAWEAITLHPGAHLAGAAAMLPVVRGVVALAAMLAVATGAEAVVWIPARSAMATAYCVGVVKDWLGEGAFPALGLTALVPGGIGVTSEGLAFFIGQELEVYGEDTTHSVRIAVRMIHTLASQGPLTAPVELTGPGGEALMAKPVGDGSRVRVGPRP